jgi:hypothetical protein
MEYALENKKGLVKNQAAKRTQEYIPFGGLAVIALSRL